VGGSRKTHHSVVRLYELQDVQTVSEGPAFGVRIAARSFASGIEPDRHRINVVVDTAPSPFKSWGDQLSVLELDDQIVTHHAGLRGEREDAMVLTSKH
jgi:hypothetical protein